MNRRHRAAHREQAPEPVHGAQRGSPAASVAADAEQNLEAEIAGYHVVRVLGTGSRAEVFLAHDEVAGPVALKVYRESCTSTDVDRELDALARHDSPHLLALIDVAGSSDGRAVAVVQRLSGPLLSTLMRERGANWQAGEIVTVVAPLVGAIASAHAAGFALGALSAREVMFDQAGSPVVIGLGRTVDVRARIGARGTSARAAMRADYRRLGEMLSQLCAQSAPGEDLDQDRFEEWFSERLTGPLFEPFAVELEQRVLEIAVPIPVRTTAESGAAPPLLTRVPVGGAAGTAAPVGLVGIFAALSFVPAELGTQLRSALVSAGARLASLRARSPGRRALLTAGVVMCILVTTAMLWPRAEAADGATSSGTPRPPTAEPSKPSAAALVEALNEPVDTANEDPVIAFPALIAVRVGCLEALEAECLEAVLYRGGALESADVTAVASAVQSGGRVTPVPAAATDVVLVERTGDAALLSYRTRGSNGGHSEPASVLMIRTEAGWRLRELFEPSGSVQLGG